MLSIRHILVPIDWSEPSMGVFQFADSLARDHSGQLVVLHVVPTPAVIYGPPPESYLKHMREELCRLKPRERNTRVQHLLAEGNPATMILKTAAEHKCDLIVMGTHGRTGLNHALLGSVTEEVIRKAPCLVLTVKTEVPANLDGQTTNIEAQETSAK